MAAFSTIALAAGVAIAAASAAYQITAANSAAKAQSKAANENAAFAQQELTRQQEQVQEVRSEKKGDRARLADQEQSTLRALMAEKGGLQTGNYDQLVGSVGYFEGMDLSRIDRNANEEIDSLQSQKVRASQLAATQVAQVNREALNAKVGAGLQLASTAVRSGYLYSSRLENPDTTKFARRGTGLTDLQ